MSQQLPIPEPLWNTIPADAQAALLAAWKAMESVLVDDRLDPGQFGDLMDQGLGILAAEGVATAAAGTGLTVGGRAEFLGRDQGPKRLAMAGLPAALPPRWRSRRLALQDDRVGGGRLGGVGGVELEPGLEIAHEGFQLSDPILHRLPGSQECGLGVGGYGVPEGFRDRKLLAHIQ